VSSDSNNLRAVSWEELAEHLNQRVLSLHSLLLTVQSAFDRNNRNLAIFNLGQRAAEEIDRAKKWLLDSNELLAWSVRNLYEIHLTLRKVLQSEEFLNQWLGQFFNDDREIIAGFQELRDRYPTPVNELHDRQQEGLKQVCDNLGIEMSRPWRVPELARSVGREVEYRMFYKFLSKYVHPTSWLINANLDRTNSDLYRNMLVGLTQILAGRIQSEIESDFDLKDRVQVTGHRCVRWIATSYDIAPIEEFRRIHYSLRLELDKHVRHWSAELPSVPTLKDIEALAHFALGDYIVQRFDWQSWPYWQIQAAKLYGAASALRRSLASETKLALHETDIEVLNNLRSDLGNDVFEAEYAIGERLDWSQAVKLALSVPASMSDAAN
jgi:hypothetical protein